MKPARTVLSFAPFSLLCLPKLPRCFVKPQLLTRTSPLPVGRDIPLVHTARDTVVSRGRWVRLDDTSPHRPTRRRPYHACAPTLPLPNGPRDVRGHD
jgi:hypothetical protein